MKVVYNSKEIGDNYNNYNRLVNKPLINSVELVGNITLNDINVYTKDEVKRLISSARSVKTGINLPSPLTPNTTYYIGPNEHNIYTVYLTDSSDPINAFVIGTTSFGKYYSGEGIDVTDPGNVVSVLVDSESVIINSEGLLEARPVFEKMVPFNGASSAHDGSKGLIQKPLAGDQDKFLMGDCTWKSKTELIDLVHPVGSYYLSYSSSYNPNTLFPGTTWTKLSAGYSLWTDTNGSEGIINAGLPNIKGSSQGPTNRAGWGGNSDNAGCIYTSANSTSYCVTNNAESGNSKMIFNAANANSIYGSSTTVQPPAICICVWRRTA